MRRAEITDAIMECFSERIELLAFPYMPLDVVRLRDSSMAHHDNPEVFRSAVLLWCASWYQRPAASLPDDEKELARLAGWGRNVEGFREIREAAMHGFVKLDLDGRLYHPVIADKAVEAWKSKQNNRRRTKAATEARLAKQAAQRDVGRDVAPTEQNITEQNRSTAISMNRNSSATADAVSDPPSPKRKPRDKSGDHPSFAGWYAEYPRRVAPHDASKAYSRAIAAGALPEDLLAGLRRWKGKEDLSDPKYIPHPATWLNDGRWKDADALPAAPPTTLVQFGCSAMAALAPDLARYIGVPAVNSWFQKVRIEPEAKMIWAPNKFVGSYVATNYGTVLKQLCPGYRLAVAKTDAPPSVAAGQTQPQ